MKKLVAIITAFCLLFSVGIIPALSESSRTYTDEELAAMFQQFLANLSNDQTASDNSTFTVTINDKQRTGTYTGDLVDGQPHGTGTFVTTDSLPTLTYTGTWKNGAISGKGTIETDSFTVHFSNQNGKKFGVFNFSNQNEKYDKVGVFNGEVLNGIPFGQAYFSSQNSEGIAWNYTGEWKNGQMNGHGKQVFLDPEGTVVYEGNFVNGNYKPTLGQLMRFIAPHYNFSVSDDAVNFIDSHNYFSKYNSALSRYVDGSFSLSRFKKHPKAYDTKLIEANNLSIIQVFSDKFLDTPIEQVLMKDDDGTIYYGFFNGNTDIDDSCRLQYIDLLPLDWSTYENTQGNQLWAVFCLFTHSYEIQTSTEVFAISGSVWLRNSDGSAIINIGRGQSFNITGYDYNCGMFTAEYNGWTGYVKGTGLSLSWDELFNLYK